MPSADAKPITAQDASKALGVPVATIRVWIHRYSVARLGRQGRHVFYDLADLAVVARERRHGHAVPTTPDERAAILTGCPLQRTERHAA